MTDDKTKRGPKDRNRINVHEPYELEYWSRTLGVSPNKLKELVAEHGVMVATIRQKLGQ